MPEVALVLLDSTGGIGRHVRSLAARLPAHGWSVRVVAPRAVDALFGLSAAGMRVEPLPAGGRGRRTVLREVAGDSDVVHAHGLRAGALCVRALRPVPGRAGRAARAGPALVVSWHNAVLGGGARRAVGHALCAYVARGADATLGASDDLVAQARAHGAPCSVFVPVAAPPLPGPRRPTAAVRTELGLVDGDRLVLGVGRLHPQKRWDVLAAAAAGWPADVQTAIVGDGPVRDDLAARVRRGGARVRLLGHRADVADLLDAADVVVLCSDWEARPLVVQEALRAGRCVVATAVGGVPGLADGAAVLVPPGRPPAVHAAVLRVLGDRALRERLGARAREVARGWPDEDATAGAVAAVYRSLLRPGRPAW